jgi:hypothetical protein
LIETVIWWRNPNILTENQQKIPAHESAFSLEQRQKFIFALNMDFFIRLRKLENLHIVFWLVKDTCWLLEFRLPGTIMVVPTVFLAAYMVKITFGHSEFLLNCAVLFWIVANGTWMMLEFFNDDQYKMVAVVPFTLGLAAISLYYLKNPRSGTG